VASGLKAAAVVAGAYLCACFVAVVVVRVSAMGVIGDNDLPIAVALTAALSLPGFVVLRVTMWWARLSNIGLFALAGAVNATIALVIFRRVFDVNLLLAGAGLVAGGVYHVVEQSAGGQVLMRHKAGMK
jgi:hypothetical protein